MSILRTRRALLLSCAAAMVGRPSYAQLVSRPIRILVGFGAGGGTDSLARVYATKMRDVLNTSVIVENKPGASQLLAIQPLMSAPPDGNTVALLAASALASGPGVRTDLPYDPLKDFSHIAMVATAAGVFFVSPELPVRSLPELIAYAKANPGKLNYGSAGIGASNHLQMEYFMRATGVSMTHIPFKSDQEVVTAVVAGLASGGVHFALTVAQPAIPMAVAKKIIPLAVTGSQRLRELPDVPSLAEAQGVQIKGIDNYTFYGLVGPAGMPQATIDKINDAVNKVSGMPDVTSRLRDSLFFEPAAGSPVEFSRYLEKEVAKWREVGKTIKL